MIQYMFGASLNDWKDGIKIAKDEVEIQNGMQIY